MFDSCIEEIRAYRRDRTRSPLYREFQAGVEPAWPRGSPRELILMPDLAVEFGSPAWASVSFLLWTGDASRVSDGRITLIGPDLGETGNRQNPFGKVVTVGVRAWDENNVLERNRDLHLKKFDLSLKGHMLRSASHYLAEWHRISKDAVSKGFSFFHLGSALIREYRKLAYVVSVEILFVTSSNGEVSRLHPTGKKAARMIQAMTSMVNDMNMDCSDCDYQDLCGEAGTLGELRKKLNKRRKHP
jgi:CO dehydrogenase/acetyl-CoA synthase beta subunit